MGDEHLLEQEERTVRPFAAVLHDLRRGVLADELSEALADVVQAVQQTGKAGKLTLTLSVKPSKSGAVMVADDVKAKLPTAERGETIMFADHGSLTRSDPRQPELPMKPVEVSKPKEATS